MKRTLANGFKMLCIGYGTFPLKDELVETVPLAVRAGYRLVDTSDNYGNEKHVGAGLAASGPESENVVVVTKFSKPARTHEFGRIFRASRKNLGGRIDVYLLHWPYPFLWKKQWRTIEDLYLAGECRAIGVCNFDRRRLEALLRFCRVKPMIDQFERHPLFQQEETAAFCRANGIQVMSYSPFARMDPALMENPVLKEIAAVHGKTVGQVILRWNIEHGDIPIPASKSSAHIAANLEVFDFALAPEEVARIDALEAGHRVRFDPDKRFTFSQKMRFLWERIRCHG